jgi:N-acetylglucosamine malate deacetylase 1
VAGGGRQPGMIVGRRILVLAPHPDDEIVACGIAAMRAQAAGANVFVLYLTTGVPERAALWAWQRRFYRARLTRRRKEALEAAALLGLEPLAFGDTPSRALCCRLDDAAARVSDAIARCGADALWVPAFEGGHQDHDAANAVAVRFSARLPVSEFAAYNYAGGEVRANRFATLRGGETVFEATPEEARLKRRALCSYCSERGNLGHVGAAFEHARPLPSYDYAAPPHAGRLFRERFQWVPFRHPRVDFTPSAEVYRMIGDWVSSSPRPAVFRERPRGEARQADRELAGALDEAERERGLGIEPGDGG